MSEKGPCFSIVYYQSYVVLLFAGDVDIIEPPGPSMTAAVGDTVELVCENDDQSTLEWSRDGMPLVSGSHYSIRYVITYSFTPYIPKGLLVILN